MSTPAHGQIQTIGPDVHIQMRPFGAQWSNVRDTNDQSGPVRNQSQGWRWQVVGLPLKQTEQVKLGTVLSFALEHVLAVRNQSQRCERWEIAGFAHKQRDQMMMHIVV